MMILDYKPRRLDEDYHVCRHSCLWYDLGAVCCFSKDCPDVRSMCGVCFLIGPWPAVVGWGVRMFLGGVGGKRGALVEDLANQHHVPHLTPSRHGRECFDLDLLGSSVRDMRHPCMALQTVRDKLH